MASPVIDPHVLAQVVDLARPLVPAPLLPRLDHEATLDQLRLDQLDAHSLAIAAEERWHLPEFPESTILHWQTLRDIAAAVEDAIARSERTAA